MVSMPGMLFNQAPGDEGLANEVRPLSHMLTSCACLHRSKRFLRILGGQALSSMQARTVGTERLDGSNKVLGSCECADSKCRPQFFEGRQGRMMEMVLRHRGIRSDRS